MAGVLLCCWMMVSEMAMFPKVNRLVELLHTYPYAIEDMQAQIVAASTSPTAFRTSDGSALVVVGLHPNALEAEFNAELQEVYGEHWMQTDFYVLHQDFKNTPLWKDYLVDELLHAYFPYRHFKVEIR
jgi:hypothetical protein